MMEVGGTMRLGLDGAYAPEKKGVGLEYPLLTTEQFRTASRTDVKYFYLHRIRKVKRGHD